MSVGFLFPGQGSQKQGMGEALFQKYPQEVAHANELLGFNIVDVCLKDPRGCLQDTQYTQPAIYTVSALDFLEKSQGGSILPDYAAGHSVGEYAALFAAGAFDFISGLALVKKRAELMAQANGGAMAAVIGMPIESIRSLIHNFAFEDIDIANCNAPEQTVISGSSESIDEVGPIFEEAGAKMFVRLKVSAAFHSRYMKPGAEAFADFIQSVSIGTPRFPVISNVDAMVKLQLKLMQKLGDFVDQPRFSYNQGVGKVAFVMSLTLKTVINILLSLIAITGIRLALLPVWPEGVDTENHSAIIGSLIWTQNSPWYHAIVIVWIITFLRKVILKLDSIDRKD